MYVPAGNEFTWIFGASKSVVCSDPTPELYSLVAPGQSASDSDPSAVFVLAKIQLVVVAK